MSLLDLANRTGLTGLQKFLGGGKDQAKSLPTINFFDKNGSAITNETRVRIKVPSSYISSNLVTNKQPNIANGIIFPYTPQITLEHKADYTSSAVMHSNFQQHFYQRSSVGAITVTGKWTVQNKDDAEIYLSTLQLLRGLTKMSTAGDGFKLSGSPPPVCRLFAYGDYMLNNVPVAVTSFRNDLPENVDYFALPAGAPFNGTMVPIVSTIAISLIPMYSRAEQQQFSVKGWLSGEINKDGYL
jgi:hypothetical protein